MNREVVHLKHRALASTAVAVVLVTSAACSTDVVGAAGSGNPSSTARATTAATQGVPSSWSGVVDPTALPLGDDMLSAQPDIGHVYSCMTSFGGRGAPHSGPWINQAEGTWDSTAKTHVQGAVTWPQAAYAETLDGVTRRISAGDLPTEQVTGSFPIALSDPARQYDPNPNAIAPKVVDLSLPAEPVAATDPSCVPMGAIGILKNGVYLYNALDAAGGDAAAHETQDVCDGHPDGAEFYHYHEIPSCLRDAAGTVNGMAEPMSSTLVGYALDGYGIYVERDSTGALPVNSDLDECHGRTSTVTFNGQEQQIYHYSATLEFPYTVGCFHGTPVDRPSHER